MAGRKFAGGREDKTSLQLNPMLASNGVDEQFQFGQWGSQWGMDGMESEDDFQEDESPESSPVGRGFRKDDDVETEGETDGHAHEPDPFLESQNDDCEKVPGEDAMNNGKVRVELEQSLLAKSKSRSINLNENPKSSTPGESRTCQKGEKATPSPSQLSNRSINQPDSRLPVASCDSSLEIDATMEIGEMLGFQFDGNREQIRSMLKTRGDAEIHQ
ncbi:hypothetical protein L1887_35729 [Cichorium endivia]|nr:hypothetical protein L1887_35729 [Cichorium endivia]